MTRHIAVIYLCDYYIMHLVLILIETHDGSQWVEGFVNKVSQIDMIRMLKHNRFCSNGFSLYEIHFHTRNAVTNSYHL